MADRLSGEMGAVPKCRGCGSQNLRASSQATVHAQYGEPLGVIDGDLHFAWSESGWGENERWRIECADCGRRMRTNLAPVSRG